MIQNDFESIGRGRSAHGSLVSLPLMPYDAPLVSVVVVTYNSERLIAACLESLAQQDYPSLEVQIIDNASRDDTVAVIEGSEHEFSITRNTTNTGFAAAHNQGIRLSRGRYYLALNPDVVVEPDFVSELVRAAAAEPAVGSVSGKLLRPRHARERVLIDSAGIYMTPSSRHLDRGSGVADRGQYERPQFVFGASGAAALYRRDMLEEVAIDGESFDEDFFAYREDADLAWRAQLLGWKSLYTPYAVATHARRVVPERRRELPPELNMHSVKNRFLLRLKNQTGLELVMLLLPTLARDAVVFAGVIAIERSSIPGLLFVLRNLRGVWNKRRWIMARRKVTRAYMLRWFRYRPVAMDCDVLAERGV